MPNKYKLPWNIGEELFQEYNKQITMKRKRSDEVAVANWFIWLEEKISDIVEKDRRIR